MQRQEQALLQGLVRAQVQGLLRHRERRLLRHEGRVLLRAQMQDRERALLRFDERTQARGPVMRPERGLLQWPERLPYPALLRRQERGPVRGQELPQPSRGRKTGWQARSEVRSQMLEVRSADSGAMLRFGVVASPIPLIGLGVARPSHRY